MSAPTGRRCSCPTALVVRDLIYDEFVSPGSNGDYVISRLSNYELIWIGGYEITDNNFIRVQIFNEVSHSVTHAKEIRQEQPSMHTIKYMEMSDVGPLHEFVPVTPLEEISTPRLNLM